MARLAAFELKRYGDPMRPRVSLLSTLVAFGASASSACPKVLRIDRVQ